MDDSLEIIFIALKNQESMMEHILEIVGEVDEKELMEYTLKRTKELIEQLSKDILDSPTPRPKWNRQ